MRAVKGRQLHVLPHIRAGGRTTSKAPDDGQTRRRTDANPQNGKAHFESTAFIDTELPSPSETPVLVTPYTDAELRLPCETPGVFRMRSKGLVVEVRCSLARPGLLPSPAPS